MVDGPDHVGLGRRGDVFDDTKTRFTLNEAAAGRGLEFWASLMFQRRFGYSPADQKKADVWDSFIKEGTVGMWDAPSWGVAGTAQGAQFDWDIAPLAKNPQTRQSAAFLHVRGLAAAASSKHPDEAWTLIKAWTAHEVQLIAAEVGSQHPTRPSAIQPYWDQRPAGHTLNLRPFTAQIPVAETFPHLDSPLLDQALQQILNDAWAKVLTQETSIPPFVDSLSPLVREILKRQ